MSDYDSPPEVIPRRLRPSLIWLVPAAVALTGLFLLLQLWASSGPEISIIFQTASGLQAGKTEVKYKDVTVGLVKAIILSPDSQRVLITVSLMKNAENLAKADTRFWNASGVDLSLNSDGLQLKTQTMASVIAGSIAFTNPPDSVNAPSSADHSVFRLADDQPSAMAPQDGTPQILQLRFQQSLRGMQTGAPVEFSSVKLGKVTAIDLDFEPSGSRFISVVTLEVYPNRLGRVLEKLPKPEKDGEKQAAVFLRDLVQHGLRAQARTGNLLTGQLYISLDFVPNAAPVAFDLSARPLRIPTLNGGFGHLQEQVATLIGKVSKMPIESIGNTLNATLGNLNQTLIQVNGQVLPQTIQTLRQLDQTMNGAQRLLVADSPLLQMLAEFQRTLYSLRTLTGLLTRQPQALLTGRLNDPKEKP